MSLVAYNAGVAWDSQSDRGSLWGETFGGEGKNIWLLPTSNNLGEGGRSEEPTRVLGGSQATTGGAQSGYSCILFLNMF